MVSLGYGFKSYVGCRIKQVWLSFFRQCFSIIAFLCNWLLIADMNMGM